MFSFGWKKIEKKHNDNPLSAFNEEQADEELDESIDWLTATKKPKVLSLEDAESKSKRLVEEGITLAENERWWEAIGRWNSALSFIPDQYKIHEMLAQVYMMVGEIYPALKSAVTATKLAPWWWPGHQTHGRALLGLGEVEMSVKAFSRAIRIQPDNMELWKKDLEWSVNLLRKHRELEKIADDKEKLEKIQEEEAREQGFLLEEIGRSDDNFAASQAVSLEDMGSSSSVASSCTDSKKQGLMFENIVFKARTNERMRPPITSTSKKRKHCDDLEVNFDPRFCKDLVVCNQFGGIENKAERIEMHPSNMVCYRR